MARAAFFLRPSLSHAKDVFSFQFIPGEGEKGNVRRVKSRIARYTVYERITLLPEPAFLVRVEERVHQIVPVVFRYLERFRLYTFV